MTREQRCSGLTLGHVLSNVRSRSIRESRKGRGRYTLDREYQKKRTGPSSGCRKESEGEEGTERGTPRTEVGGEAAEEERSLGPPVNSSNISHRPNETLEDRKKTRRKLATSPSRTSRESRIIRSREIRSFPLPSTTIDHPQTICPRVLEGGNKGKRKICPRYGER